MAKPNGGGPAAVAPRKRARSPAAVPRGGSGGGGAKAAPAAAAAKRPKQAPADAPGQQRVTDFFTQAKKGGAPKAPPKPLAAALPPLPAAIAPRRRGPGKKPKLAKVPKPARAAKAGKAGRAAPGEGAAAAPPGKGGRAAGGKGGRAGPQLLDAWRRSYRSADGAWMHETFRAGDDVYLLLERYGEYPEGDEPCEACGSADEPCGMLECGACLRGFHMRCLSPPLKRVPKVRARGRARSATLPAAAGLAEMRCCARCFAAAAAGG